MRGDQRRRLDGGKREATGGRDLGPHFFLYVEAAPCPQEPPPAQEAYPGSPSLLGEGTRSPHILSSPTGRSTDS